MRIETIEWKNFNSYGNVIQKIDFTEDRGNLFLLIGGNGNGKSTISEVITFALYGKIEKKNKADLPNRINKNLWCRIVIFSKNRKIEIIRGISPGIFSFSIDGKLFDTANNSNAQDYLELEIFDIPYQVFKNIIVLSINDFRSFITMSPSDKRNIIDRLFGFTLINQMKEKIKSERKSIKEDIRTIHDELNLIDESVKSIENKINLLTEENREDRIKLAKEYKSKIIDLHENRKKVESALEKLREKESSMKGDLQREENLRARMKFDKRSIIEKLKLYENSQCPTCGSSLDNERHHHIKVSLEEKRMSTEEDLSKIEETINENQKSLNSIFIKLRDLSEMSIKASVKISQFKSELENLVKIEKESNVGYLSELKEESELKRKERILRKDFLQSEDAFLDLVESVFGEDGVKNLAMRTIIPSLNLSIQNMTKQIHLPYSIKFDEKFDCLVHSMGEEVNPRIMSTGERKKADFIIIISLLKIIKMRYPSLNLLFLDEIFSSVDATGIYEIVKILRETSRENQINTWVINHTELPAELFDKRVEAIREGNFSKLIIENVL